MWWWDCEKWAGTEWGHLLCLTVPTYVLSLALLSTHAGPPSPPARPHGDQHGPHLCPHPPPSSSPRGPSQYTDGRTPSPEPICGSAATGSTSAPERGSQALSSVATRSWPSPNLGTTPLSAGSPGRAPIHTARGLCPHSPHCLDILKIPLQPHTLQEPFPRPRVA